MPGTADTTQDRTLTRADGRVVGFAEYGDPGGRPVLWCHGGPGSRLEPAAFVPAAADAGVRVVGVDRPGYGLTTAWPGRSIADWVTDGLAVADELGLDEFAVVGVSTGGAYALALAAAAPDRVTGVVACCALTDMSWAQGRAMMPRAGVADLWDAPDRGAALARAADAFGDDGSRFLAPDPPDPAGGDAVTLPPSDLAMLSDPTWLAGMLAGAAQMFAQGVVGYTDDRLADGAGWSSFDPGAVRAPTVVLHGAADPVVPVAQAIHTAALVPGATLWIVEDLGHLSIVSALVPALGTLG
jgi:pimeloyl-ACP methyl ester carboxylesterase